MPRFSYDGVEIAFLDQGEGEPIVLVHGFASNKEVNWVAPGWVTTLTRAGRRVIALDNRGHGASTKLYDPAAYHSAIMAGDVRALIEHLGLPRADVMGYSMGARNTVFLALANPERVRSAVLGGVGIGLVERAGLSDSIAEALEAPSLAAVSDPTGHMFRAFAEQTKSDLRALAACLRGSHRQADHPRRAFAHRGRCRSWWRPGPKTALPARRGVRRFGARRAGACHPGSRPHVGRRRPGF